MVAGVAGVAELAIWLALESVCVVALAKFLGNQQTAIRRFHGARHALDESLPANFGGNPQQLLLHVAYLDEFLPPIRLCV